MYSSDKPNRIKANQIKPHKCYFCFNEFEPSDDIKIRNRLPHHVDCIEAAMKDKPLYNLIQDLLDQYQLYEDEEEFIIVNLLEYSVKGHGTLKQYVLDVDTDKITLYFRTDIKCMKVVQQHHTPVGTPDDIVIPIEDLPHFQKLFE